MEVVVYELGSRIGGLWVYEIARLYPDSPRYELELDPYDYRAALAKELRRGAKLKPARPATTASRMSAAGTGVSNG